MSRRLSLRWPVVDALVASCVTVFAVVDVSGAASAPEPLSAVLTAVWMSSLALRTRAPFVMAMLASVGAAGYGLLPGVPGTPLWSFVAVLLISFSTGLRLGGRRSWAALLTLAGSALLLSLMSSTGDDFTDRYVSPLAIVGAPFAAGALLRRSRAATADLERMRAALDSEREAHARDAAAAERNRVARELHDVISHSVSVMIVQAGAAELQIAADSPVRAQVQSLRTTGQAALAELRHQLGALRDGTSESSAPMPALADIARLAEDSSAALEYDGGGLAELPVGTALAAYRVVQEALTNVRRHAAGATTVVRVHRDLDDLVVEVVNGAGGVPSGGTGGFGLRGMRERVAMYSGRFEAGPTDEEGWRVTARMPVDTTQESDRVTSADPVGVGP